MVHSTKERLLDAGLSLLLEHGYHDLGIQALLDRTGTPRGSFYHHFDSKEDFALKVVDRYMAEVHRGLDSCLDETTAPPAERVRRFFELSQEKYRKEGYLGCLLGGLGQELSAVSDAFRLKIEGCLSEIAARIASCLEEAREQGDIPADSDPEAMANLLLNCWEGAALRSRLWRRPEPLVQVLDFYFGVVLQRQDR